MEADYAIIGGGVVGLSAAMMAEWLGTRAPHSEIAQSASRIDAAATELLAVVRELAWRLRLDPARMAEDVEYNGLPLLQPERITWGGEADIVFSGT